MVYAKALSRKEQKKQERLIKLEKLCLLIAKFLKSILRVFAYQQNKVGNGTAGGIIVCRIVFLFVLQKILDISYYGKYNGM